MNRAPRRPRTAGRSVCFYRSGQQQLVVGLVGTAVPQPAQAGRGPRISSRAGGIEFRPRQGFASGKTLARRRRRPICDGEASGYDSSSLSSASSEPLCPSRPRPAGDPGFHPARAELNSARGKVLPPAKRLHGAGAAPSAMGKPAATTATACRRPRRSRWLC